MPWKPKTPCRHPGCGKLTDSRYCDDHRRETERRRNAVKNKLYNRQWERARRQFLLEHPLCVTCERNGIVTAANEVDHIVPHRGDRVLFWDQSNLQSLCRSCHSRKTVLEDGAFQE